MLTNQRLTLNGTSIHLLVPVPCETIFHKKDDFTFFAPSCGRPIQFRFLLRKFQKASRELAEGLVLFQQKQFFNCSEFSNFDTVKIESGLQGFSVLPPAVPHDSVHACGLRSDFFKIDLFT